MKFTYEISESDRNAFESYWNVAEEYRAERAFWKLIKIVENFLSLITFGAYVRQLHENLPSRPKLVLLGTQTLEITKSHLNLIYNNAFESYELECVNELGQAEDYIFIKVGYRTLIFPKNVFDDNLQQDEFLKKLGKKI